MVKTNRHVVDDVREEKPVRKILPYTVTEIGGREELKAWKAQQAVKQEQWEAGISYRYAEAKSRAVGVLQGTHKPTTTDDIQERYRRDQAVKAPKIAEGAELYQEQKAAIQEERSVLSKLLDKFLDIKY